MGAARAARIPPAPSISRRGRRVSKEALPVALRTGVAHIVATGITPGELQP